MDRDTLHRRLTEAGVECIRTDVDAKAYLMPGSSRPIFIMASRDTDIPDEFVTEWLELGGINLGPFT